jgi:hypothetical protein
LNRFKVTLAATFAVLALFLTVGLASASSATAAPAAPVAAAAPAVAAVPAFSPCAGYCVNIQNMYWSLNTNVKIGICDHCGQQGLNWNWLLGLNQQTPSVTPDVEGYYIGAGWCAKEFRSYGNNEWSEKHDGPITGPKQVTTYDFSWYRVYAYQAQAPYGCNF